MIEHIGEGSFSKIAEILDDLNIKKVFVVRGNKSFKLSGAASRLKTILKKYKVFYYSDCVINPDDKSVLSGTLVLEKVKPDIIIAIGGGSVIDTAKLISILSEHLPEYRSDIITGKRKIVKKGLPIIAVPTTSGSGSEATHFATIYKNKKKFSVAHPFIKPLYAIIDSELVHSLPSNTLAVSGVDALSHSIESLWSKSANNESKTIAKKALKRLLPNIKKAVLDNSKNAISEIHIGAHLAGKAIDISKTTAAHALSYPLTSFLGVPHGQAVGILIYKILKIHETECIRENKSLYKTMEYLRLIFSTNSVSKKWQELLVNIGLKTEFADIGFKKNTDLKIIYNNLNLERLNNHPIKIDMELVKEIFD